MAPAPILDEQLPHPPHLGLSVCCSGDYVGRSLWLDEWYLRTSNDAYPFIEPRFLAQSKDDTRVEMCSESAPTLTIWTIPHLNSLGL